jgi:hypothetical protein
MSENKDCCQVTVSYKFISVTLNTPVNLLRSTGLSAECCAEIFFDQQPLERHWGFGLGSREGY